MIERTGDLFDTDAPYIGHGVNCQGVMGAGIAKLFREKFPHNYKAYKIACESGKLKPGGFFVVPERLRKEESLRIVTNFASQNKPGADASYKWLSSAVMTFAEEATTRVDRFGGRVAIPEIGCGIGGLEWEKVRVLLVATEILYPKIEFEVWHYGG